MIQIVRQFMGLNDREVWKAFADKYNGDLYMGRWFDCDEIRVKHRNWIITIDTENHRKTSYTRARAHYQSNYYLLFNIYGSNMLSEIGKWFGMQDIVMNDPLFDKEFIVRSGDEEKIRQLLDHNIREYMLYHSFLNIRTESFSAKMGELCFEAPRIISTTQELTAIYGLFALMLDKMHEIGIINEPQVY